MVTPRPKPSSGVDDVDHIYERIQELRKQREKTELDKEAFLSDQENVITFSDPLDSNIIYQARRYRISPRWWRP